MLEIKALSFSYGQANILQNLDLDVQSGSIHGILGINGAGKTSLFKCLYGLLQPNNGHISWVGNPLNFRQIAFLETSNFLILFKKSGVTKT